MSRLIIITFLMVASFCGIAIGAVELYSDRYDYIDAGPILANPRSRSLYYNCFLGNSPCATPDAKFFKETFPEALVTKCSKCTARQKVNFEKIVTHYMEHEPDKWNTILTKSIADINKPKPSNRMNRS